MTPVFVDTACFIAYLTRSDVHHRRAVEALDFAFDEFITTEFVLIELANFTCRSSRRAAISPFWQSLLEEETATVVPVSSDTLRRGLALYNSRLDKDWSLVDCTSFVIMEDLGIQEVLTTDHHFEQAGFTRVL